MKKLAAIAGTSIAIFFMAIHSVSAAGSGPTSQNCDKQLTRKIPARQSNAPSGSAIMQQVMQLGGTDRDAVFTQQALSGNMPSFLRDLTPVSFSGTLSDGQDIQLTICVTPDYLAVGNDNDFVRVPMGLAAAAEIADRLEFLLPTTKMVDAIYAQAGVRLAPSPMKPTNKMSSTDYLMRHNQTVEGQRAGFGHISAALMAGQKKDIVLSNRLRNAPGRVAIYGWHRTNGKPIQPLSTVHGARYADYSHGVRLVSGTAYVNGEAQSLTSIMQDPQLSKIVSNEGPIARAQGLLASLYQ